MSVNVEVLIVERLNADPTVPSVFMDVPPDRPARFVTVERTSGGHVEFRDLPVLAVQCWAESRWQASELADTVATALEALRTDPQIGRLDIASTFNFPDPESGQARYEIVVEMVTKAGQPSTPTL